MPTATVGTAPGSFAVLDRVWSRFLPTQRVKTIGSGIKAKYLIWYRHQVRKPFVMTVNPHDKVSLAFVNLATSKDTFGLQSGEARSYPLL